MPSEINPETLREVLNDVLDQRARIGQEQHREHHAWVQARIDRERARSEFLVALAHKSLPGIAWGLIAACLGWVINYVRTHITWN